MRGQPFCGCVLLGAHLGWEHPRCLHSWLAPWLGHLLCRGLAGPLSWAEETDFRHGDLGHGEQSKSLQASFVILCYGWGAINSTSWWREKNATWWGEDPLAATFEENLPKPNVNPINYIQENNILDIENLPICYLLCHGTMRINN